ncbi:MAG: class A beta-lactamase [Pseudomonadota bacterium]|uniref:class A beta-lactamase n=1 Tax=Roseovarius TaxID=74030 RepID=UPI0022A8A8CB|nr:class A beta-lactamase [Roseovarius sp. EGI FJ00037]MCZ0813424.1 class A beta-lactamase [Roseovarius sp. EGI FJ00037]
MKRYILTAGLLLALAAPLRAQGVEETARATEAALGGRVGVMLRAPAAAPLAEWRADERFPVSSTFKVPLCGAVLARVDKGEDRLERVIAYGSDDLVTYSPVTEAHAGTGMTLGDLCGATIALSDNTAGNLLLTTLGGPEGFTAFLRESGDAVTRLDRWETALNEGTPGDVRDTTTPAAMAATLERLLFGDVLSSQARGMLEGWMERNQVGDALIRTSLPEDWTIGDKTGAGGHGSRSIIAVIRGPRGDAWLAAIYLTGNDADMETRNAAIARIGAAMVEEIEKRR